MSSADFTAGPLSRKPGFFERLYDLTDLDAKPAEAREDDVEERVSDILQPDERRKRERFIPVTRFALLDRLTKPWLWPPGQAADARRFFRYLDYWRQQQYFALLLDLEQTYETFSPDSDLLMTRKFSEEDRDVLKHRVFEGVEGLLQRANYERIDPTDVEMILTRDSHYGLDLTVDMKAFERIVIYYRGATNQRYEKRIVRKFLRKEEFNVPIFQRLFIMFKLKPFETRVEEVMQDRKWTREAATKWVDRRWQQLPPGIADKNIYLKLFKNIPRTDIEMVFPNTEVRFRSRDKLRLGVTAGGGLGMGAFGAAGKIALLASNPIAAMGALAGLGGIAARQAMGFFNQKQRYMVVMAQNLYFHTMADNRGVILKIAARGAEEDVKEEMLLYSVLAKEKSTRADLPSIDLAIESYLHRTFGVKVDFEIDDALDRLIRDGIVVEKPDGTLATLPPAQAAKHIDDKWDLFLDHLPDPIPSEGYEFEGR
ncbi:DUF3754 domain-containing protein [Hyphomicrobium methylovorum]|uniref:TMEM143 family protein n=1 Tax=Hyphomicrobium methylovorum TaxID=84 RepID=UPI0015E742B5|nr:TMEM143 family protein [Hyphomicrobium methylovorum]MBA2126572.1 DUF3754 domain-containing protein [Hyphomicrobium methylovorum]